MPDSSQDTNYSKNYSKSRPPYIIVDSSFVLMDIINPGIMPKEFLQRCHYLSSIAGRGVRLLPGVRAEITALAHPYTYDKDIRFGLQIIRSLNNYSLCHHIQEYEIFNFLCDKVRIIGERLSKLASKPALSKNDINFAAYSILKTLKGHVISATCDKLLESTINETFAIAHPALVNRGYRNTTLKFAHSFTDLDKILKERKLKNLSQISFA